MINVIITGASRGIGYDTALVLARNPAVRVLALSRNEEKLVQLAAEAQALTGRDAVHYQAYNLTDPASESLLSWVATHGPVQALINNAGLLLNKPFLELTLADWQALFTTNVFGVVELVRVLLPQLAEGSHIVNVGSMGGFQGSAKFPGLSAYSASKAALANLTECLAEELKEQKIAVNCLALGAVQTEMLATAFPGYEAPVQSPDMASFFAWFALQGQQFFNGKVLPVSVSTP